MVGGKLIKVWFEHPSGDKEIQGKKLEPFEDDANPDHVFEIHPITAIDDAEYLDSLVPVEGYKRPRANNRPRSAFGQYGKKSCRLIPNKAKDTTSIVSSWIPFNYVEFALKPHGKPKPLTGGSMVMADVLDPDMDADHEDAILARNARD